MHTKLRYIDEQGHARDVGLKHGLDGNVQTLIMAVTAVRARELSEPLRQLANSILVFRRVPPRDTGAIAKALFEWVRDEIRWTEDPADLGDKVQAPDFTARRDVRYGDCVDKSVLLAALLATVGIRQVRFGVLSLKPGEVNHVFIEVLRGSQWVSFDPTPEHAPAGWSAQSLKRFYFPIFDKGGLTQNLGDWLSDLINIGVQTSASLYASSAQNKAITNAQRKDLEKQLEQYDIQLGAQMRNAEAALDVNAAQAVLAQWQQIAGNFAVLGQYPQNITASLTAAAQRIAGKAQTSGVSNTALTTTTTSSGIGGVPLWAVALLAVVLVMKN